MCVRTVRSTFFAVEAIFFLRKCQCLCNKCLCNNMLQCKQNLRLIITSPGCHNGPMQLQARVALVGPQRWLKPSKPSMPSAMALTLVVTLLCLWHGPGTYVVWNLTLASRLLRHLSYAWTTLDFQERDLDGAGRHGVMLMSTSVLVQGPFVTSL